MDTRTFIANSMIKMGDYLFGISQGEDSNIKKCINGCWIQGQALNDAKKGETVTVIVDGFKGLLYLNGPVQKMDSNNPPPLFQGLEGDFQYFRIEIKRLSANWIQVVSAKMPTHIVCWEGVAAIYIGQPLPATPIHTYEFFSDRDAAVKYWHWQTTSYPENYQNPTIQMMQRAFQDYRVKTHQPTKSRGLSWL